MHFRILSIQNKSKIWEEEGVLHYIKQLGSLHSIKFIDIACKSSQHDTSDQIKFRESEAIIGKLRKDALVIAWDKNCGKEISSADFANFLAQAQLATSNIDFIIGGSHGVSSTLLERADHIFSASKLTFPHRLFKIILVEQIFRAIKIQANHPYHK